MGTLQQTKRWGALALVIALAGLPGIVSAEPAKIPEGYRLAQTLVTEAGIALQVLEDQRITAQLHKDRWGNGLDEDSFDDPDDLIQHPLLEAMVRLLSASGEVVEQKDLGYPLAMVKKAPLTGMPEPVYFLTIDETATMGTYSGPATQLLLPARQQLTPLNYKATDGKLKPLTLADTGKAAWKIATSAKDGPDELLQVSSFMEGNNEDDFVTRYQTFRFVDGHWQVASRQKAGYWDTESDFPARTMFP
nr:hypothetical protein [uncultured Pseudomonas sp.]